MYTSTLGNSSYRKKKYKGFLRGRKALLVLELIPMLMLQPVNVKKSDDIFFPEELGGISHS